jgi:hypothetical protein
MGLALVRLVEVVSRQTDPVEVLFELRDVESSRLSGASCHRQEQLWFFACCSLHSSRFFEFSAQGGEVARVFGFKGGRAGFREIEGKTVEPKGAEEGDGMVGESPARGGMLRQLGEVPSERLLVGVKMTNLGRKKNLAIRRLTKKMALSHR